MKEYYIVDNRGLYLAKNDRFCYWIGPKLLETYKKDPRIKFFYLTATITIWLMKRHGIKARLKQIKC